MQTSSVGNYQLPVKAKQLLLKIDVCLSQNVMQRHLAAQHKNQPLKQPFFRHTLLWCFSPPFEEALFFLPPPLSPSSATSMTSTPSAISTFLSRSALGGSLIREEMSEWPFLPNKIKKYVNYFFTFREMCSITVLLSPPRSPPACSSAWDLGLTPVWSWRASSSPSRRRCGAGCRRSENKTFKGNQELTVAAEKPEFTRLVSPVQTRELTGSEGRAFNFSFLEQ